MINKSFNTIDVKIPKPIYKYLKNNHSCKQCGKCCHCKPIVITPKDIKVMAFALNMNTKDFKEKYTEVYPGIPGLSHFKNENPCVFLDENNRCKIYNARPNVCRDYPLMHGTRIPKECATLNELIMNLLDEKGNPRPELLVKYTKDGKGY